MNVPFPTRRVALLLIVLMSAGRTAVAQDLALTVAGVTAYDVNQLLPFARALAGNAANTPAETASAIERLYREDGYLLAEARATVDETTGCGTIAVMEGFVDRITVQGLRPRAAAGVERYLRPLLARRPLRAPDFERAFMLASDLAGVHLRSQFVYDNISPGAHLIVTGTEWRTVTTVTFDAVGVSVPGSTGAGLGASDITGRAYVLSELHGLAAAGDLTRAVGIVTMDPRASRSIVGTIAYRLPVSRHGTYLEARAGNAISRLRFRETQVTSEQRGRQAAFAIGHPLRRSLMNYLYLVGEYEYADASDRVSLTTRSSTVHAARVYVIQGYTTRAGGVAQWSLEVSGGLRPESNDPELADGARRFVHVRGAFGGVTALSAISDRAFLRFESTAQWATQSLPDVERMPLGFQPHLRGYSPFEVDGDRGLAADLEFSHGRPLETAGIREFMPYVFLEGGTVALDADPDAGSTLASAGIGARLAFIRGFAAEAWVGVPLRDGPLSRSGRPGLYVQVTKGWVR